MTRGTKGLYRVQRIINKYDGMMTIRTSNGLAGLQKGGYANLPKSIKQQPELIYFPGTIIRMRFSPYNELTRFKLSDSIKGFRPEIVSHKITVKEKDTDPAQIFSNISDIRVNTVNFDKRTVKNILFVFDFQIPDNNLFKTIFKQILLHLSKARHPHCIGVYGYPEGWDWLSITIEIDEINKQLQENIPIT
jgi:hypothetical protein